MTGKLLVMGAPVRLFTRPSRKGQHSTREAEETKEHEVGGFAVFSAATFIPSVVSFCQGHRELPKTFVLWKGIIGKTV